MKRFFWLMVSLPVLFTGCGGVDWFPTTNGGSNSSSSATTLTTAFSPAVMLSGNDPAVPNTSSTLSFTITNGTGNPAHSGLGFVDQLPAGLTATAVSGQCGGTFTIAGSKLTFANGSLASGATTCTITAVLTGAANGNTSVTYTNGSANISGLAGGLVSGVTDQTLQVFPFSKTNGSITASNVIATLNTTLTNSTEAFYDITVDVSNSGAAVASVTVVVVALDANGQIIPSTNTPLTGPIQPGGLIQLLPLQNFVVPVADSAKIKLWTIFSVN